MTAPARPSQWSSHPLSTLACALALAACSDSNTVAPAAQPAAVAGTSSPAPQPSAAGTGSTPVVSPSGNAGTGALTTASAGSPSPASAGTAAPALAGSAAPAPAPSDAGSGGAAAPVKTDDYAWPADCEKHVKLVAHNVAGADDTSKKQVTAGVQYYASYYYKPEWGEQEVQGLQFRSIIDNKKIVHHWIIYGVNTGAPEENGAVQGGEGQPIGTMPNEFYIAGWAPGAPDVSMPDNVGLHMPTGADSMIRLEVHYFNTSPEAAVEEDASGVEFCYTTKKRENEAAIHWLGNTSLNLPAHAKTDVHSTCRPQITAGPVHLMGLSAHMHKTGVHAQAILNRAGGGQSEMLIDDSFDFNNQSAFKLPRDGKADDVVINQGDTISVTCSYDNTTDSAKTFGENTENEMCFFYAMAWPRGQLMNNSYFSLVPGAEREVNCISTQ